MFVQFLANTHKAPTTVKNYISGARHWIRHHNGSDAAFSASDTIDVLKSVISKSNHVPNQAPPLTPSHVREVCKFFDNSPYVPLVFKPALLIAYACFLRSSNLLSPTTTAWGGPHTLLVSDIMSHPLGLQVLIRSTKTIKSGHPVMLLVAAGLEPSICPVIAWYTYLNYVNPYPRGPAFVISHSTPLTPKVFVSVLRLALKASKVHDSDLYSIHSIRRGAAQAADRAGAPKQDIKTQGTWSSDAGLHSYVKPIPTKVPSLLAAVLAN